MAESSTEGRNMQRSIFSRFIFLIIVSVIICGISSSVIFKIKQDISTKKWIEETTYLISKMYNHSSPLLSDISNEMVYSIFIVDNNGLCISDPNNNYDYSHNPEFINAQEGFVTTLTRSEDNPLVYYLFASLKLYDGNVVIVKHKYSGIFQYVFDNLPAILLAMSVAFVLALFLARNYAKSLTLSIEKINQLQLEKDKMDQLQKQRQEFFSNASHELKTPITSIRGFAEMLDQGLVGSEEGRRDIIKRINIESIRMSNLISDILEISKLESRESEERKFINISEIIREAIEAIQSQRLLADVTINMKIPKSVVINANRNHLYELVSNLIENAVKYNKKGGYVNIELKESESDISFGIEDGGIGIPKESQSRIFERFYRVDYGRDRTIGGTGLGLSIVKHIVNCYDGEIFINSEAGVGTKIMITLPK